MTGLTQKQTKVGVIHELYLSNNQGFSYILRKSYISRMVLLFGWKILATSHLLFCYTIYDQ